MSLGKKKAKDMSFMSKMWVQGRLDDMCSDLQMTLMVREGASQELNVACNELMPDYEDDVLRVFTKKKFTTDAARELCVDVSEMCTTEEYDNVVDDLLTSTNLLPFGPLAISISPGKPKSKISKRSPQEKAMQAAKK